MVAIYLAAGVAGEADAAASWPSAHAVAGALRHRARTLRRHECFRIRAERRAKVLVHLLLPAPGQQLVDVCGCSAIHVRPSIHP